MDDAACRPGRNMKNEDTLAGMEYFFNIDPDAELIE